MAGRSQRIVGVQCWQYTDLGFGPGDGGYASVYLGWTGLFTIFVFGAMVWLETLLVGVRRTTAELGAFTLVWTTLGLVEVVAFILLYGVK